MYINKFKTLIIFCMICILTIQSGVYAIPASSAIQNSVMDLESAYKVSQKANLDEETKVKKAVDTYFLEQLEARKNTTPPNWIYIFDSSPKGQSLRNYETGRLSYSLLGQQYFNSIITWYNYTPEYQNIMINDLEATVNMINTTTIKYPNSGEVIENDNYEPHTIILKKSQNEWKIMDDIYIDEMKSLYPEGTNWKKLIDNFDNYMNQWKAEQKELQEKLAVMAETDPQLELKLNSKTNFDTNKETILRYDRSYNRNAAANYGLNYSENTGDYTTDSYNSKFKDYSPNDCQSFVSQAIWYGFGGVDTSTAIDLHQTPMIDRNQDPTIHDWWADSSGTDTNWMWTHVDYFKNYITDNYNNSKAGVSGHVGTLNVIEKGDYIYTPGHVMLVVDVIDYNSNYLTDYDEVYFSGHSINRRNQRFCTSYPTPPSGLEWVWVLGWRTP